jgi:lysozyme
VTPEQSEEGLRICAGFLAQEGIEGFRAAPYLDSVRVATIGIGSTIYDNGVKVTMADAPITRERALVLCMAHLRKRTLPDVLRLCPGLDTPRRLAAILSWGYNVGTGNLETSGLRREVNNKNWPEAQAQVRRWNKANGAVLKGLTTRRALEAEMLT